MTIRYPLVLAGTSIQELQAGDSLAGINYTDITGTPTNISTFINDSGYLTTSTAANAYLSITSATATYQALSGKNTANGYAGLDGSGLIPSSLLPSYVDDVLEYADFATLPTTGETAKIYVTLDTNKTYRWSGSQYTEVSASPGSTDSLVEGSLNLYYTNTRARNAISVTQNLTYNNSTGVITGPDLSGHLTISSAASTYQPILISGTNIKTINNSSIVGSGNLSVGLSTYTYANRADLRTLTAANGDTVAVENLGTFIFSLASTEPDDDETCFATSTGCWLIDSLHPDLVASILLPEIDFVQNQQVLFGATKQSYFSVYNQSYTYFYIMVTGASVGDSVVVNPPGKLSEVLSMHAFVSKPNQITVYLNNASPSTGGTSGYVNAGIWRAAVFKGI